MYEDNSFESIQEGMLSRIRDGVDKREGSVIWDATAAVAHSLMELYFLLNNYQDLILPDTSVDKYLDRFVSAFHIIRKQAVKAIRKIITSEAIAIGTRWQIQDVIYLVTEKINEHEYAAECEQYGDIGNLYYGPLSSFDSGSTADAILGEVLTPGAEEEDDDTLRDRFFERVKKPAASGNVYDYYNWAMSCPGVGAAKVFPLADGPGTVKVVITDSEKSAAGAALLEQVLTYIEQMRPIGADVTVVSAVENKFNINVKVKLTEGTHLGTVENLLEKQIGAYLQKNAFRIDYVSLAKIGNLLMEVTGVEDYAELQINGTTSNLTIGDEGVAVVGTVRLEVL